MPDLDLIVPSALVDPDLAVDLLKGQDMPHLRRILARTARPEAWSLPRHASPTPWQAWVFGDRAGLDPARVNLGELWAMACGVAPMARGGRFVVEPAHFKIANDHLRLDDPRALDITMAEARELAAAIEPVLAEAGWRLDPIEPATLTHWLVARDDDAALSAAAIERAIGDNVAAWQPRVPKDPKADALDLDLSEDAALSWRRCVNEIQMLWFGHPVNEARELRGQPTINTLWLSGNGAVRGEMPRYAAVDSGLPLLAALPVEPAMADAKEQRALESFDRFVDPARRDDWSGWREQLARLDARLAGVLQQQAAGTFGRVTLVLCGRESAKVVRFAPGDRSKFWRAWGAKPSLVDVLSEGAAA